MIVWLKANQFVCTLCHFIHVRCGDALMPALFSLAQHSALNAVAEELRPNEKLLAFLDDLYVVCAPDRVATIYALLQNKLWQHARIRVNLGKTQLWNRVFTLGCEPLIRAAQVADPDSIVWRGCADLPVNQRATRVLGTPLGQPEFVVEQLREVSQSHASLCEKIPAWLLLLFCASTRANYPLRAVPPALSEGFPRVGMPFRVAGTSRRSTKEHCAPSFPSRRVGPGQCRSLQVNSMLGQLG